MAENRQTRFDSLIHRLSARLRGLRNEPLTLCFWLLVAVSLVPIWAFAYFPSQDGPSHLDNANILRTYPWKDLSVFRDFYTINAYPLPNWTTHLLLAALMAVFPVLIAEKLFLTIYVIALPVAVRYCIHGLNPKARAGALLVFPLIYNFVFQRGYYNFSLSVVVYFVCVGYWVRYHERLHLRRIVTLGALFILLYFSHLVSTLLACITIALFWLWFTYVDWRRSRSEVGSTVPFNPWIVARRRAVRTLAALLPAVLLGLWYVQHQGAETEGRRPVVEKLREIFTSVHAHQQRELLLWIPWEIGCIGFAIFVLLARLRSPRRELGKRDAPLVLLAALLVLYLAAPSEIGNGGGIEPRIVLYLWLTLALWIGMQTLSRTTGRYLAVAATLSFVALTAMNVKEYASINDYLKEYLSAAPMIPPGSTLLSVELDHNRGAIWLVHPFQHAAGYIAAQRDVVDFSNYEADTNYFPTLFLPAANPYTHLGDAEDRPLSLDLIDYTQRTGRSLDYVLLWGGKDAQVAERPDVKSVLNQLEEGYEEIYVSPKRGLARLYRRKTLEPMRSASAKPSTSTSH